MPDVPLTTPHRVAVLALEPVVGFDMTIAPTIFGAARDADEQPMYQVSVCGLTAGPIPTSHGFAVVPQHGPGPIAEADTVVIPGTYLDGPVYQGELPPAVAEVLARIRPDARIMSICTGAFVLASAGLLDGKRATTHWAHAERFAKLYPAVDLDPGALFVDEGDVLTSAGVAAGVDLCLHVVRGDFGSEIANRAARRCVVPPVRAGGQSQFIEQHLPEPGVDGTAPTRAWALTRLDQPLDVTTLARHATMSVRTFSRRFVAETGLTPARWLAQQRLEHARHLLETTDLPVERIASKAGLGTGATLRQQMRSALGVAPITYRKTFRAS
ncbi:MAG: helix-turn-helix domain-containing protein [Micromonosporaceae bacterium]|nr:helix-turn-helix domain-containing protein [Micromonosporaceae bacterium]